MIDRLLGLTRVSWSDAEATLGWRYELPAYGWVLIVLGCLLLAAWSYSRLVGPRVVRFFLASMRAALLILAAVLLAGPMLVVNQEQVEPDTLIVLVDRSPSMQIRDMLTSQGGRAARISRDEALRSALDANQEAFTKEAIGPQRNVIWVGFDDRTFLFDSPDRLPDGDGNGTSLRTAIEQAMQRAAGQPISGIVLATDGRSPQQTGVDLVRKLNQQAINVFSVPLGAETTPLDLAVSQVDAPAKAFVNDMVPVTVWLDRYPADAPVNPSNITVRLVDEQTGQLLDERRGTSMSSKEPVRLRAQSKVVGPVKWRVELEYDAPDGLGELISENNTQQFALELIDRPLRVLYVEGYPRWEYRYLKNMMLREKSVECSVMLISADRTFAQEGDVPLTRLPQTAEEFLPYDVIVIGDLPADYFSVEQLGLIRDQVATHGTGLLWIGGEYNTPRTYDGTVLANMLPMKHAGSVARADPAIGTVIVKPTALADQLNVMRLVPFDRRGVKRDLWPADLPRLWWVQNIGALKPTAEVIAEGFNDHTTLGPVVSRMRYGAGQSLYVASDEIWRWRYARGDYYYQQFWTQLLRMLGRTRINQDNTRVQLTLSNRRVNLEQAVVVSVRISDAMLVKHELPSISVAVEQADVSTSDSRPLERLQLLPKSGSQSPGTANIREYQTIWRPMHPGRLRLKVTEPVLAELSVTQTVEVFPPNDEMRQPAPDLARLNWLAEQTGGQVVPVERIGEVNLLAPNRARRTPNDIREPLWNSYLTLIVIIFLLTAEWITRKVIRLV